MLKSGIDISNPGKILFPKSGFSKEDVVDFYTRIADHLIPHIQGRAITLKRYTEGIGKKGFFNKHAPEYFPDFIERVSIPMHSEPGRKMEMITVDEVDDLIYLAGQDVIELHMSLSRVTDPDIPDQVIFDLDPSDDDFEKVRRAALALKELLDEKKIRSFVNTTGSRGVHIHIPIKPDHSFDEVKPVVKQLAEELHEKVPELTTLEHRKNKRGNKVFIDYLRNDHGMTAIAPYSLRAIEGAPVATPIDWDELNDPDLGPQSYTLENIFRRLGQKTDPWEDFHVKKTALEDLLK